MTTSETATLYVRRVLPSPVRLTNLGNRFRTYRVPLDGDEIGRLHRDEMLEWSIPPGRHTLRMAIDWSGNPELTFNVEPGDTARFTCAQKPGFPPLQTFTRRGWITLEQLPSQCA